MFCTTLRRRSSFAASIGRLTSSLGLRENDLATHDLEIPFGSSAALPNGRDIHHIPSRCLRALLLAPSAVRDVEIERTVERVAHFASLTGGQDLIIIFLLYPPQLPGFVTANEVHNGTANNKANEDGVLAYSKLQAEMVNHAGMPSIPIFLLSKLDGLVPLLQKHIASLMRPSPKQKPAATPFELLQLCTANPPMSQHTAFILSDLFADLRDLATACTAVDAAPESSSPAAMARSSYFSGSSAPASTGRSSQVFGPASSDKLKRLRDLIGEEECRDIVDFWKEEWTID